MTSFEIPVVSASLAKLGVDNGDHGAVAFDLYVCSLTPELTPGMHREEQMDIEEVVPQLWKELVCWASVREQQPGPSLFDTDPF